MHRSRERNKGRGGKIQKRVKRCKRKGKVLSMEIRNKREEEGETTMLVKREYLLDAIA